MNSPGLPEETINSVARSIYQRSCAYGFSLADHLRLTTAYLSLCEEAATAAREGKRLPERRGSEAATRSPARMSPSGRLAIRPLKYVEDFPLIERWMREVYAAAFLLTLARGEGSNDLSAVLLAPHNHFSILMDADAQPLGLLGFLDHQPVHGRAEIAVFLGSLTSRGRGFGSEAVNLWMEQGRSLLSLRKIYVELLEADARTIEFYHHLGFVQEGHFLQNVTDAGSSLNTVRLARLLA